MTATLTTEDETSRVEAIGQEIAVLCRIATLEGDLPGTSRHFDLFLAARDAIDEFLDQDMAVDPIEYAISVLVEGGHLQGLEQLAWQLLGHRDDHGNWQ